jgi:hypothetical protein
LLRATQSHAANYAATDKMQQVGQQPSNKMIRWLRIPCRAVAQCRRVIQ